MPRTLLTVPYYRDARDARRAEIDDCVRANVGLFDYVRVVSETAERPPWFDRACDLWTVVDHRQTIGDLLDASADWRGIVVIANADIAFSAEAIEQVVKHLGKDEAWCLTRWDEGALYDVDYSQDAWAFRTPIRPLGDEARAVTIAVPGVDNRLAFELARVGYQLRNPSRDVRVDHRHDSKLVTSVNTQANRVSLPYLFVTPHRLGQKPRTRLARRLPGSAIRDQQGLQAGGDAVE